MQIDMHYYGTFALARAAGLSKEIVRVIATAAQFVDDNAKDEDIILSDGSCIHTIATAHHATNISNANKKDQRKVWVPFHFLPGNEGESYYDRLVCRMNSSNALKILDYAYQNVDKEYFVELVGVIAHVYADTFAHYGFAGINHKINLVDTDSIKLGVVGEILAHINKKKEKFLTRFTRFLPLGHGCVYTNPDRPYLSWSFKYGNNQSDIRDNHKTFMEGSEGLFNYFKKIANLRPDLTDPDVNLQFDDIKETVSNILSQKEPKAKRILAWQTAGIDGSLYKHIKEDIPTYRPWNEDIINLQIMPSETVKLQHVYKFFQAASIYRTYVLRDLLPQKGLIVG
ncbi:MAG: hypothetical protein OCD02_20220 [Spirochaetaceae bacterium]